MSSDVVKCLKDCFSVRKNSRENKVMICRGRAKKPARVQRGEGYAEQRELKSLSFHGVDFFIQALSGLLVYPALPAEFMEI